MTFWRFWRNQQAARDIFLLHLDPETTVRVRREADQTYTVIGTQRIDQVDHALYTKGGLTFFDAQLYLGITIGAHVGEYRAIHGESPPYLHNLAQRLTRKQEGAES